MAYAYPSTVNWTVGFKEIITYVNEVSYGWFANMILIAVYLITVMGVYNYKGDFLEGMAIAGFLTAVIGILFWIVSSDFVSGVTLVLVMAIAVLSFAMLWIGKRSSS